MGKIKALKKDKVPAIQIDKSVTGKKKTFDEDVELVEEGDLSKISRKAAPVNEENDDESPEEVQAESLDILKLKQHLDATSVVQKITKAKRRKQKKSSETVDADEYLDASVLNSLNNPVEDEEEEEERFSYGIKSKKQKLVILKEPPKNNKRKIGTLEVEILDDEEVEEPTKIYKLAKDVAEFDKLKQSLLGRTRYGSFISQRRPVPSKTFKVDR